MTAKAPGGVLYVGDLEQTYYFDGAGLRQTTPVKRPVHRDTLYDIASLTKVVGTATAILSLRDAGKLRLDQSVAEFVPVAAFRRMTLLHLLTHTSGLVSGNPYYEKMTTLNEMFQRYAIEGITGPPEFMHEYSDVGYMLLGRVIEAVAKDSLPNVFKRDIFDPLDMQDTMFNPPEPLRPRCAATERDPWRGRVVVGEVHDQNTYAVGGVSGHAGLFSTAEDLAKFCRGFLSGNLLDLSTVEEMTRLGTMPVYPWQGLGWQVDPWSSKVTGFLPSRTAFGHAGWTGTSIWMDRANNLFVILLGNTCHPDRARRDNENFRRIVHTAVGQEFYERTNAHSGLDRLVRENFAAIRLQRMALLTNHAAVDEFERHILDVLELSYEAKLRVLYTPEHGLYGRAEAGQTVRGERGPVPVVSLYGGQNAPTREELADIDLFVVDLQDVGARYYTYMATMKRCIEACARARVPVVVLDRPNPLGGEVLEGPVATVTDSLVCCSAIPIRHGMTMGELATWFAQRDLRALRPVVRVNYLDNWQPRRLFDECALPWVAPSPNIPDAQTALLYAGLCLFEATNLNEGRGTKTPFQVIGAPWLDPEGVIAGISFDDRAGCLLEPTMYTPRSIAGVASSPTYEGEPCRGIRVRVEIPRAVRSVRLALALIQAIRRRHPDAFGFDSADWFDTLAGGPGLRGQIERDEDASEIVRGHVTGLREYDLIRPKLYDADGIPEI